MGEEPKEEEKKEGEEEPPEIVLKVYMHCEGCAKKVEKSLKKFQGVDEVKADSRAQTVVVKAKTVDPITICERVQKKTGRKTQLISPLPKPPPEEEPPKPEEQEEEKKEEPTPITVVLKVRMHCEACAQVLQRRIKKMEGVDSVVTDMSNEQVTVKGFVDPDKLVERVYRRTRRPASIMKEEDKQTPEEEKKAEEENNKKEEEDKAAAAAEKEKKEEGEDDMIKKSEFWPTKYTTEYVYAPQIFSDENPNACSIM